MEKMKNAVAAAGKLYRRLGASTQDQPRSSCCQSERVIAAANQKVICSDISSQASGNYNTCIMEKPPKKSQEVFLYCSAAD